ncbi:hypothetical protein ACVRXQ_06370 [Streptococcus panodentis]|uniref:hypothetical protein n=1 Tax=Streptococcus TaxID=1301 RepID=UPI0007954503|nr:MULTISPECIES: hypothetical protein [Streptococcus]KXT83269.1 hypothetical protein STRDD11_01593 [Streptococcus sp. DD11]
MKINDLFKWLLASAIIALLFGLHLLFPAFPQELIPLLSLAAIIIVLKIFQAYEK